MHAKDILKLKGDNVETIVETAKLGEAIDQLAAKNIGAVLVVDSEGKPSGILSERDVVKNLAGAPTGFRETAVSKIMTVDLITCSPDASVDELMDTMTNRRIRHLPVMRDGALAGILSIGDVVKHRIREVKEEAEALKSYITSG